MFSKKKILWYFSKICFCIIITLLALIAMKGSSSFKDKFYKIVYENNICFAKINAIYEKYAGSSIPFKEFFMGNTQSVFEETLNYKNVHKYLDGARLNVESQYLIPALEDGLVIFVGMKEGYGNTVIIGQSNGIDVWYSNIDEAAVSLYDYVKKGSLVGNCHEDYFYLVFKKDGQILNYEEYI